MNRSPFQLALAGLGSMFLTLSCGGGGGGAASSTTPPPTAGGPPANTIWVGSGGLMFTPNNLTVTAGTTVTWEWKSSGHSVDSGAPCTADGVYSSGGTQSQGHTMTHIFATAGTYNYFCDPHCGSGMTGIVTVN